MDHPLTNAIRSTHELAGSSATSSRRSHALVASHPPLPHQTRSQRTGGKDFQWLWKDVTSAEDEAGAIRALAEILIEKEGRAFISRLDREDAKFCIELLDRVSCDSCLLPSLPPQIVWPGHHWTRS